jgi:methylmalonyl-CoA mutase
MIGTNQYPNLQEMMLEHISSFGSVTDEKESTYRKLKKTRGTQVIENIRLLTERFVEQGQKKPTVFLLTIGNLAMRKARATFATNFFGCAGFAIIDNPGFATVPEGVRAAAQSGAEIVVICSSDEEYPVIVPEICEGLKTAAPKAKRVLAGYPKDLVETFNVAGIEEYIHVRSDLVQTLKRFQEGIGIKGILEQ